MVEKLSNMWTFFVLVLITAHQLSAEPDRTQRTRVRRQYYVCPPGFKRISNNCYYFSTQMATWQDAHYDCQDKHSELAILLTASEDQKLRSQLNKPSVTPLDWWIGGIYDWEQMQWKWGVSGKKLEYHGFSRMDPDNKDKLKWNCIILDPFMKYKWSARSCVHGKHYICQRKVDRVGERGLRKLRKKYKVNENNQLNEIRVPIYEKPIKSAGRKHENQSNGHARSGLKHHRPNSLLETNSLNNAFAHRKNTTQVRVGRKRDRKNRERKGKGRKNRKNKNKNLQHYARNGTDLGLAHSEVAFTSEGHRDGRKRKRRNKSKENSAENSTFSQEELKAKKHKQLEKELKESSMEDITQKTTFFYNTISPLHPRIIIEEHDFRD